MESEFIEYPNSIKIDGSRIDDDQFWRVQRIHRILGYAQALADIDNNEDFYKKIANINDQKGMLSVAWNKRPTEKEKEYLQKAWDSIVTNYESEKIEHDI
jgi:hypothetical protein